MYVQYVPSNLMIFGCLNECNALMLFCRGVFVVVLRLSHALQPLPLPLVLSLDEDRASENARERERVREKEEVRELREEGGS